MGKIITELSVSDIERSLKFYENLGFEKTSTGIVDDKGSQWYSLGKGEDALWLLREDIDPRFNADMPRGNGVDLFLNVEDVDAVYAKAQKEGLDVFRPIETQWYGLREFGVADPDGYLWTVNTQIAIGETTGAPA